MNNIPRFSEGVAEFSPITLKPTDIYSYID
ncbi:hypothetical protein COMA1_11130 [Candidatus Nitrospira nitrosa]|uniref:Uncharacterized protein n=1 Tax=Candidatus Nitrospira nitrosa TaxID=1742972 RepID=A0A0S4L990_9BACT|nr:hypothetical protein COMA1_11130 [Candidatus Nitrospira nitrosa]